jgi:hypothetical protein
MLGIGPAPTQPAGQPATLMPASPTAPAAAPSDASEPLAAGGEPATPEEQAMYDEYVENAMEIIYPQGEQAQVSPQVLAGLKGEWPPEITEMMAALDPPLSTEPLDNIAATAVVLTMMLEGSAATAGQPMPDEVIWHGGAEIVEELVDLGEDLGLFELGEEEVEQAFYRATDIYRQVSPRMDEQAQEGLMSDFEQVVAADREGRLGDIIPGMSEAA